MAKTNIVVVGAGFAGVYATKHLAKHYKRNKDVTITLIDRHSYFTYVTELHEIAADRVPEAQSNTIYSGCSIDVRMSSWSPIM